MRTIKIIYHDSLKRISTCSVHRISAVTIGKPREGSPIAYLKIYRAPDFDMIELPTEKAYELYDRIASWLSNEVTDLEVELIYGMNGDAIDYIAVEK